jgi:hypothetical protein
LIFHETSDLQISKAVASWLEFWRNQIQTLSNNESIWVRHRTWCSGKRYSSLTGHWLDKHWTLNMCMDDIILLCVYHQTGVYCTVQTTHLYRSCVLVYSILLHVSTVHFSSNRVGYWCTKHFFIILLYNVSYFYFESLEYTCKVWHQIHLLISYRLLFRFHNNNNNNNKFYNNVIATLCMERSLVFYSFCEPVFLPDVDWNIQPWHVAVLIKTMYKICLVVLSGE